MRAMSSQVEEIPHHHRNEAAVPVHLTHDARPFVVGQRHDLRERVERCVDVVGLLGDQHGAPVHLVAGNDDAEAVEQAPAWRGDHAGADAVLVGQRRIARGFGDLHLVEPHAQATQQRGLARPSATGPGG